MKNPPAASCLLCCCDVEAGAAPAFVRYKLNKNLGGERRYQRTASRSSRTVFDIDVRVSGKEVPQPVQRTGELE